MKRHQFFVSAVVIFIVVFFTAVMWARVIWMPKAMDLVTTAANEKLNGTVLSTIPAEGQTRNLPETNKRLI